MASSALERIALEMSRVLVISPNDEFRAKVANRDASDSCVVDEATGGAAALAQTDECAYATALLDRRLVDLDAEEVLAALQARQPNIRVIFVDSEHQEEVARAASVRWSAPKVEQGASKRVLRVDRPANGHTGASPAERPAESLPGMYSADRAMQQVFRMARLVAPRDTTVLITGETGTGKELVANAIHQISDRRNGAFVVVNCAAIPEELLESELFGHTRGAFTGAIQSRIGRIHASHGGTLFLDEVGDLPLSMQAKLLRFLQHGEVQRLGSPDIFKVDVRVVAATNANLKDHVAKKEFRRDLYYRLAVFPIQLPSLSTRRDDIVPLADYFIEKLCGEAGIPRKSLTSGAAALFSATRGPATCANSNT